MSTITITIQLKIILPGEQVADDMDGSSNISHVHSIIFRQHSEKGKNVSVTQILINDYF